jgi:Uma2 family endonuclease
MSTVPIKRAWVDNGYPTRDGKPMGETDWHINVIIALSELLRRRYEADEFVYVGRDLLVCYEEGNRNRHLSPDVFVVRGVPRYDRGNYLIWEEGRVPEVVFEITSASTRREDETTKFELYRDVWRVKEYFLFDPLDEYLDPRLQGYRLRGGEYQRIRPVAGRIPSRILGLHLEASGRELRLYDPQTGEYLLTSREREEQADQRAEEAERLRVEERRRADAEIARLRAELEALRRRAE